MVRNCPESLNFVNEKGGKCKKGKFFSIRHNNIRDGTANILKGVWRDPRMEPKLHSLIGERFEESTAFNRARSSLWCQWQWFLVSWSSSIFSVNPGTRYANQRLCKWSQLKGEERAYKQRAQEVQHDRFTMLVMFVTSGMGRESKKYYCQIIWDGVW